MGLNFDVDRLIINGVRYPVKARISVSNRRTLNLEPLKEILNPRLKRSRTPIPVRSVNEQGKLIIPKVLRDKYMLTNEYVEIYEIEDENGRQGLALFKNYT